MKVGEVVTEEMIELLGRTLDLWTGIIIAWHPWQGRIVIRKGANNVWRVSSVERPDA